MNDHLCHWIVKDGRKVCARCGVPPRFPEKNASRVCKAYKQSPAQPHGMPPTPEHPRHVQASDLPCSHRGKEVRVELCQLCGSVGRIEKVYECALHGECTAARWKNGRKGVPNVCLGCPDRDGPELVQLATSRESLESFGSKERQPPTEKSLVDFGQPVIRIATPADIEMVKRSRSD